MLSSFTFVRVSITVHSIDIIMNAKNTDMMSVFQCVLCLILVTTQTKNELCVQPDLSNTQFVVKFYKTADSQSLEANPGMVVKPTIWLRITEMTRVQFCSICIFRFNI